jgi:hypothetical protein
VDSVRRGGVIITRRDTIRRDTIRRDSLRPDSDAATPAP